MTIADREPVADKWVSNGASARWTIEGRPYLNFAGACYLALHREPALRQAAMDLIASGAPFAQQLPPNYGIRDAIFETVERTAAEYLGTDTAVFFATGYLIGQIGLCAYAGPGDHLYLDAGAHYNLVQATQLAGLPVTGFAHCDAQALQDAIAGTLRPGERPLIVTDGMFATTGDLAPLDAYARLVAPLDGRIFVDDAHAFGVLGDNGRGTAEHFGVEDVAHAGVTLSKAFCAQGAAMGCSREAAERANRLPPKRGANAGSTISAAVSTAALRYMSANPSRRTQLSDLARHARQQLRQLGLQVSNSPSPVLSFKLGSRSDMRRVQHRLFERGIYLPISDYLGAGPEGLFRCAIFADHSIEDIDRLASELGAAA
ncbi:MAG: aminotransferase class I/II-fold pyridoxal phosphate-dependent enzyme [Sphingomonadales bacterium]|nr:MAG: aminotransferase class I/II-fold pyridoxal phosphate-dependent enzyme [Sphingomonadales bacterium]